MAATKKSQEIAAAKALARQALADQFVRMSEAFGKVPQFVHAGSHTTSMAWITLAEYAMKLPPDGLAACSFAGLQDEFLRREKIISQLTGLEALPHD